MENERAVIGGNNPPSPIDDAVAPYGALILECENWCDGGKVETEAQMEVVDALLKQFKTARTAVNKARDDDVREYKAAHTAAIEFWKPTLADFDRIVASLVATVGPFKRKLAAEKAEAERKAWETANAAKLEAERKAREADAADLEAQREAQQAQEAAMQADKAARAAKAAKPKGLRKVQHFEIVDMRALVNWIATNDKPAMAAFAEEYARTHHKTTTLGGDNVVKQWEEKEAF